MKGAVPDQVRGRVFTLLDIDWSTMRLLSLAIGSVVADALGIRPLFWGGGTLLFLAGVLGLALGEVEPVGSPDARLGTPLGRGAAPILTKP